MDIKKYCCKTNELFIECQNMLFCKGYKWHGHNNDNVDVIDDGYYDTDFPIIIYLNPNMILTYEHLHELCIDEIENLIHFQSRKDKLKTILYYNI